MGQIDGKTRASALAYARRLLVDRTTPVDRVSAKKMARRLLKAISKQNDTKSRALHREIIKLETKCKRLAARCAIAQVDLAAATATVKQQRAQILALEETIRKLTNG